MFLLQNLQKICEMFQHSSTQSYVLFWFFFLSTVPKLVYLLPLLLQLQMAYDFKKSVRRLALNLSST